jgi:uridylate kinase
LKEDIKISRTTLYKRVLIKLGGESLSQEGKKGFEPTEIDYVCQEIRSIYQKKIELAIVIGAGNIFRGKELPLTLINSATADFIGMLSTLINALALQDALLKYSIKTRVMNAFAVGNIAELYARNRCLEYLTTGEVVIIGGGTGNPYFTTDTAAALRAVELGAQILIKATKVDAVYSDDPKKSQHVEKFAKLSYMDVIIKSLKVMDITSIVLCMENKIPISVVSLKPSGNLLKVIFGESIGTYIS